MWFDSPLSLLPPWTRTRDGKCADGLREKENHCHQNKGHGNNMMNN